MRAGPILICILLICSPMLTVSDTGAGLSPLRGSFTSGDGWNTQVVNSSTMKLMFEKSEYIGWNLSGNLSINVTVANLSNETLNLSLSAIYSIFQDTSIFGLSFPNWYTPYQVQVSLPALGEKIVQFNISINKDLPLDITFSIRYIISAEKEDSPDIICQNYTTVTSLAPYSVKIIYHPANMGEYTVLVGAPFTISANVSNYSDKSVAGKLFEASGNSMIEFILEPGESKILNFKIAPLRWKETVTFSFWLETNDTRSQIGFDFLTGEATNVTFPNIQITSVDLMTMRIDGGLELDVPGQVNISVLSMADTVLRNQRFDVHIEGWLKEMISHPEYFVIRELEPGKTITVPYNMSSRVAGSFSMVIDTAVRGQRYSFTGALYISAKAGPVSFPLNYTPEPVKMTIGDKVSITGYIQNSYLYPIRNVRLTVMLISDIRGFLSRDDFISVEPEELDIKILEANQSMPFQFNVTLDSPGRWGFAVGAFWGGNATYGGENIVYQYFTVSRTPTSMTATYSVIAIFFVAATPKFADFLIRYKKGIH